MATVKCIKIDTKNKEIRYENMDSMEVSRRYKEEIKLITANQTYAETSVICFDDLTIDDPKNIPHHGFFLWLEAFHARYKNKVFGGSNCPANPIIGDAVVMSFKPEVVHGKPTGRHTVVDTSVSLEAASRLVIGYNNGVEYFLPEFTCMLNECDSEPYSVPSYEIQLRLEGEFTNPQLLLDKRIQNLSPQIVTFSLYNQEIMIVTGRISNLEEKVHVAIYETHRADMRCIGACTLAANKIPGWVKGRLEDFFRNHIIVKPFLEDFNFRQYMDDLHRELGID